MYNALFYKEWVKTWKLIALATIVFWRIYYVLIHFNHPGS